MLTLVVKGEAAKDRAAVTGAEDEGTVQRGQDSS